LLIALRTRTQDFLSLLVNALLENDRPATSDGLKEDSFAVSGPIKWLVVPHVRRQAPWIEFFGSEVYVAHIYSIVATRGQVDAPYVQYRGVRFDPVYIAHWLRARTVR
jgi:hypothetical protein